MSDVRAFGAAGDGRQDDTEALRHALTAGDGLLELPRGEYRLTRPLVVDLSTVGRFAIRGAGGTAKLIMAGPGPAIQLVGTHGRRVVHDPGTFNRKSGCPRPVRRRGAGGIGRAVAATA